MNEAPHIYTSRGNLPIASLEYATRWEDAPTYLKFVETYRLAGEVVRESAHVYVKQGLSLDVQAEKL